MPENNIENEADLIISQNQEEWKKLTFLLSNPEGISVCWINCDTDFIKRPLHDAISKYFPQFAPYDIFIDEKTESLKKIIFFDDKDKIPPNPLIHIFGIESAVKNEDFRADLNFHRDSVFRKSPGNVIFWADFATGTILSHKTYDFWSWMSLTFDFNTPPELLTARQKEYRETIKLESREILLPEKEISERISHLEHEWEKFLESVNGKPTTERQMSDAVTIARALALEYRDEGKHQNVVDILQKLLHLNPETISILDKIDIGNELSMAYRQLGNLEKAKQYGEKALNEASNYYGKDNPAICSFQSNLGVVYWELGDFENAKIIIEEALNRFTENYGENLPMVANMQANLSLIYQDLDDLDKALELMEKALINFINNFGPGHPKTEIAQSNLAMIYADLGNLEIAKDLLQKALSSSINNFGENHPTIAVYYNNLSAIYNDLKLSQKAKEYMQKAYEIRKKVLGETHPHTQGSLSSLKKLEEKESHPSI